MRPPGSTRWPRAILRGFLRQELHVERERESDEVILDLTDWLPREDWRPLITALHVESTPPSVEPWSTLASEAQSSKDPKVACQFLTVAGLPCH